MEAVQDINQPNSQPKMEAVGVQVQEALTGLTPFLTVQTDDKFMSSVYVRGSHDPKDQWPGNIWENSRYFALHIVAEKGKRYYTEGERVTVEVSHASHKLNNSKLRKYTGPVDKAIAKIIAWIESN